MYLSKTEFVKPYYIEELDCEGLSAADIARSLLIDPGYIRKKLRGGFLERLVQQGFRALPIRKANDTNGLEYEEFLLDVSAAKFVVAKHDSEKGDAYLAFLINLERRVIEFEADVLADPLMREIMHTAKLQRDVLAQKRRLDNVEDKIDDLEQSDAKLIEALQDFQLSNPQRVILKALIDAKAESFGAIRFAGMIQRDLKAYFKINATNGKWYHLAQRNFQAACDFVSRWKP